MAVHRNRAAFTSATPILGALLGSVAALAMAAAAGPVRAQAPSAGDDAENMVFEEIVVTARKREETLYETPMAITAFSADGLAARNITVLADVGKYVPSLHITRFGVGNPSHAAVFIRGRGLQDHIITTDPQVGVYVDGVYLGRQMGANLNLANVERIEVLRGPQGTLYGRNAIGGAVNIITQKPGGEEVFRVNLTGGSRLRAAGNFYSSFNLADNLGISIMGAIDRRNGVGKALKIESPTRDVGELFEASGRVAINWQASNDFSVLFTVDAVQGENGQSPTTIDIIPGMTGFTTDPSDPFGVFGPEGPIDPSDLPANPDDTNTAEGNLLRQSNTGIGTSLTAELNLNDQLTTKFIGSFRHSDYTGGLDDEGVFTDFQSFPEKGEADQFSFELQLNGEYDQVDFVTGIYFFREEGDTFSGINTFISHGDTFDINQTTKSYAAYAHFGYQVMEDLKLGVGGRYTRDHKNADALFTNFPWFLPAPVGNGDGTPGSAQREFRSQSWDSFTWDFTGTYTLSDSLNFYATVQRGYQNGAYPARPFGGPAQFNAVNPFHATNYEAGIKGTVGGFLQIYLSGFHTRYTNLPLQVSIVSEAGFVTINQNAGRSRVNGFEVESNLRLSDGFSIQTTVGFVDDVVTFVAPEVIGVVKGEEPPLSPKWTVSVAPQYIAELNNGDSITFRADYSYRGSMFGQPDNNQFNRISGRGLVGFNVKYDNLERGYSLAFYGRNIFNKIYDLARLDQAFSGFTEVIRSNDRSEFGLRLSKSFGG